MRKITSLKTLFVMIFVLVATVFVNAQGTETFTHSSTSSSYSSISWTGTNGLTWTALDSRGDQVITATNKAICIRQTAGKLTGPLTDTQKTNGVGVITFTAKNTAAASDNTKATTYQFVCGSVTKTVTVPAMGTSSVTVTSPAINSTDAQNIEITITGLSGVRITIDDLSWTAASANQVEAPTFSVLSGNYASTQNVAISTTTAGASIYYTTNGNTPTTSSALYTSAIAVSSTTTIKAIAVLSGMSDSPVATATYTFPTNVADIAALRAAATPGFYKITGEAVLILKSTTRNSKYVQDATGALLIDDASGVITTAYNLGDGITGITGTIALYNGMLQLTPVVDPGVATSTNNTVTPIVITPDQLINNQAKLVKIQTVSIAGSGNFATSTSYVLNGNAATVLRTQYADLNYIGTAIPVANQDLTGVVLVYNTTAQLVPRSLSDFVALPTTLVAEPTIPTIAANVGSAGTSVINVSGLNLTGDVTLAVSGTDASLFTLSTSSVAQVGTSTEVTINYTPIALGSHTATLTLTSPGAATVTRTINGTSSGYTGLASKSVSALAVVNGSLQFTSSANQTVEVYSAVGQKLISRKTVEGLNVIPMKVSGVIFVKLGTEVTKVIM